MRRAAARPGRARMPRSQAGAPATRPGTPRGSRRSSHPGTSWKWNSSSGVTPSWAAIVVPAAIATGRRHQPAEPFGDRRGERDHPRRRRDGQLEPDRVDEPRVEHQQRQHRRGQDGTGRTRLAQEDARQREARHRPGTQHRRLGAREHDEQDDDAEPEREARDAARSSARRRTRGRARAPSRRSRPRRPTGARGRSSGSRAW